jgi:hypothetical protein
MDMVNASRFVHLSFLATVLIACGSEVDSQPQDSTESTATAEALACWNGCPGVDVCSDGACVAPCDVDADCAEGLACANGLCLLVTEQACRTDAECAEYHTKSVPDDVCQNGVCLITPEIMACSTDDDCADDASCQGGQCAALPQPAGTCSADNDCAGGQICGKGTCIDLPSPGLLACATDSDCSPGLGCFDGFCADG